VFGHNLPNFTFCQNLYAAMTASRNAVIPVYNWMNNNPGVNITGTDFPYTEQQFLDLGLPFHDFVDELNTIIMMGVQQNDTTFAPTGQLYEEMNLIWQVLYVSTDSVTAFKWLNVGMIGSSRTTRRRLLAFSQIAGLHRCQPG
jgi:hypothetical protein